MSLHSFAHTIFYPFRGRPPPSSPKCCRPRAREGNTLYPYCGGSVALGTFISRFIGSNVLAHVVLHMCPIPDRQLPLLRLAQTTCYRTMRLGVRGTAGGAAALRYSALVQEGKNINMSSHNTQPTTMKRKKARYSCTKLVLFSDRTPSLLFLLRTRTHITNTQGPVGVAYPGRGVVPVFPRWRVCATERTVGNQPKDDIKAFLDAPTQNHSC